MGQFSQFLAVNEAPRVAPKAKGESFRKAEFSISSGTIEVPEDAAEGDALEFLEKSGQDPAQWEVTGFRRLEWGDPRDPKVSVRFTYKRREQGAVSYPIDELLEAIERPATIEVVENEAGPHSGVAVLIGDNQFGKGLEDPSEAIGHALNVIDEAAYRIALDGGANEILVAWLGDHIEGFVSQGGANSWRTKLTLTEQIRAIRRIMLYALESFAPLTERLVMAAIPGNHGQSQRIAGKGVTKYTDNHDVEALVSVADAAEFADRFDHVEFLVPKDDEISLVVRVGGIAWGLVHGDQFKSGQALAWWAKQTFGGRALESAEVLLYGHHHHLHIEEAGPKLAIGVPALETESMWWEHRAGTRGNPGIVLAYSDGAEVSRIEPIRAEEN